MWSDGCGLRPQPQFLNIFSFGALSPSWGLSCRWGFVLWLGLALWSGVCGLRPQPQFLLTSSRWGFVSLLGLVLSLGLCIVVVAFSCGRAGAAFGHNLSLFTTSRWGFVSLLGLVLSLGLSPARPQDKTPPTRQNPHDKTNPNKETKPRQKDVKKLRLRPKDAHARPCFLVGTCLVVGSVTRPTTR